jgi:hypothetical protein
VSLTSAANLPPVSLTQVANLPPVSTTPTVPVAKFSAGVVDTCGAPSLVNILQSSKKFEMTLMLFSGGWGKMIQEKNLKPKFS